MDEVGMRLDGLNKAKIARAVWGMLPEALQINVGGYLVAIPVKQLVSEDQFGALVQRAFDEFTEFYEGKFEGWGDLIKERLE